MKVTAAIFKNGDQILLMRRAVGQPLAGEWEYPGGKFEDGEDGPTCLRRELFEELGSIEACWLLELDDLGPFIVDMDSHGRNYFDELDVHVAQQRNAVLEQMGVPADFTPTKLY